MSKFTCLVVCVVAVSLSGVYAVTDEEKNAFIEHYKPILAECSQSFGVSDDEINSAKEKASIEGFNPCFMGCMLKKTGVIDAEGKYDPETGLSQLKGFLNDANDFSKFEEVANKCKKVNDEAVSDGPAGCERAKLLMSCILENKAELPV